MRARAAQANKLGDDSEDVVLGDFHGGYQIVWVKVALQPIGGRVIGRRVAKLRGLRCA